MNENKEPNWTFFTNHTHVLVFLELHGSSTIKEMAYSIGITQRAVQNIIYDLEASGVITKEKVGRNNKYIVNKSINLRHPLEEHCSIGDVLNLVASKNS